MTNAQLLFGAYGLAILSLIYLLVWLIVHYWSMFYKVIKSIFISLGQALVKNEYVARALQKNPKTINFLKKHFSRESFWGLSATLFAATFLYVLFLLAGVVEDFIHSDPIVAADTRFNQLMLLFRSDYFIRIFLWITSLGRWPAVVSVVLVFSLILWIYKKRSYITAVWLSLIGSTLINSLSKLIFHRPRPLYPVYLENSFSFPSGHATVAIALYGFIIYYLLRNTKKLINRTISLFFGLILITAIGFSRLYLGVHYLSDVWAGCLSGALWLILGISWVEWQRAQSEKKLTADQKIKIKIKLAAAVLILAEIILLIYLANNYHPNKTVASVATPIIINQIYNLPTEFNLPRFSETITATKQEPLSFIIASNDRSLISGMRLAGWLLADPINDESLGQIIGAAWSNSPYPTAPMTPSFWNGEVHSFGFEKPTAANSIRARSHARFWKTNIQTRSGDTIYVGTASLDTGVKWGITHKIDPAIDTDREKLFQDLQSAGVIKDFKKEPFVPPTLDQNFTGDVFFSDGEIYVLTLK